MRIYGGHDYYDCALSMGIDPTITLLRGRKDRFIPIKEAGGSLLTTVLELTPRSYGYSSPTFYIECVAVAFCDKVYRGVLGCKDTKIEPIWSAEKARAFAAQRKNTKIGVARNWRDRNHPISLEAWFTPIPISEAMRDYMIRNKVSILLERPPKYGGDDKTFEINPSTLYEIGFVKAIDPYTAFQELSMWIGGVLGGTSPEIVSIKDDKVLIENHGFDNRFSFRGPQIA